MNAGTHMRAPMLPSLLRARSFGFPSSSGLNFATYASWASSDVNPRHSGAGSGTFPERPCGVCDEGAPEAAEGGLRRVPGKTRDTGEGVCGGCSEWLWDGVEGRGRSRVRVRSSIAHACSGVPRVGPQSSTWKAHREARQITRPPPFSRWVQKPHERHGTTLPSTFNGDGSAWLRCAPQQLRRRLHGASVNPFRTPPASVPTHLKRVLGGRWDRCREVLRGRLSEPSAAFRETAPEPFRAGQRCPQSHPPSRI